MSHQNFTLACKLLPLTAAILASSVFANDEPISNDEPIANENIMERIKVTGSKIKRLNDLSVSPMTVISGEEIADLGLNNVSDILRLIPATAAGFTPDNANFYPFASGVNFTDLRNLDTARTLVLVNGRRFVSGYSGQSEVDLNTIPTAMVERIDVITGGASAVYGSDAIAGVVNIITRTDVDLLELDVSYTQPEQSGGEQGQVSLTSGGRFIDNTLSFAFNATYAQQKEIREDQRDFLDNPVTGINNPDPNGPARIAYEGRKPYAWRNEAGTFLADDGNRYTFDQNGNMKLFDFGEGILEGPGSNSSFCGPSCEGYDPVNYGLARAPLDRLVLMLNTDYHLNDNHRLFSEITFVNYQSEGETSPPFHNQNTIQADNAFLPDETRQLMTDLNMSTINLARSDSEFGSRTYHQDRQTFRFLLGIDGYINENWDYMVHVQRGELLEDTVWKGQIWTDRYEQAKDAIYENGNIVCRDADARANGCVPMNLFGVGQASQESIDWVGTEVGRTAKTIQTSAEATVSGSLLELPAGYLYAAFSAEYRKESSSTNPDQAMIDNTIFGLQILPLNGEFDVTEFAAELNIPILDDMPLVHELNADLAYRWMDYSSAGQDDAWKIGLTWMPIESLRIRATNSKSVRAPNISELYGASSQTFANITDVCDAINIELGPNDNRKKNCQSIGLGNGWNPSQNWYQQMTAGELTGNSELKAEVSHDYTLGFVYQPEFIDDFLISLDYWAFDITDAIAFAYVNTAVEYCYDSDSLSNDYCNLFVRDSVSGEITDFSQTPVNTASFNVKGLDIELAYGLDLREAGVLNFQIVSSYLEKWEYNPTGFDADLRSDVGRYDKPRWTGMFIADWQYNSLKLEARSNYRHSIVGSTTLPEGANNYNEVPSHTTWDFTGTYDFDDHLTVRFGVRNAFDLPPPRNPNSYYGWGYYDTIGRAFFLGANYRL
ncbi:TonB-dependent receptor domain-containing protein [Shewanella gaetbuli]